MNDKHFSILFTRVKKLSNRSWYKALIARFLSEMGVPQDEQPAISLKIFEVIDAAVPVRPIDVMIDDVTVLLLHSAEDHYMAVDRVTRESMEAYRAKLIPATKSAIEGLEKVVVTVDRGFESCAICIESLEEEKEKMVTRLPCSHYYHGDCIVQWLKINHVCPLCRYPMPIREAAKS